MCSGFLLGKTKKKIIYSEQQTRESILCYWKPEEKQRKQIRVKSKLYLSIQIRVKSKLYLSMKLLMMKNPDGVVIVRRAGDPVHDGGGDYKNTSDRFEYILLSNKSE